MSNDFGLQVNVTYFFPKKDGITDISLLVFNLNGIYNFYSGSKITAYALAGFNDTSAKLNVDAVQFEEKTFGNVNKTKAEFGFNAGLGFQYKLDSLNFFVEAKMGGIGGDASQFVALGGLRINLLKF